MEIGKKEVEVLEQLIEQKAQAALLELEGVQLAYAGGGIGDVVFAQFNLKT